MESDTHTVASPVWLRGGAGALGALMDDEEADAFGIHIRTAADVGLGGLPGDTLEADPEDRLGENALSRPRWWPWTTLALPLRPRILLAEDDADMRHLIASALARAGYEVVSCRDGIELLDRISPVSTDDEPVDFDLIISDIRMPGADGLSLLEELRHWPELRPLQMILMTAFGDEPTHRRARECGAVAVFDKPFEVADLLAKVGEIVCSPRELAGDSMAAVGGHLLVADGEPERRAQLVWALRAAKYEVEICRSAGDLASRLSDVTLFGNLERYDALVCSDSLPGGSLWSVLSALDDLAELPPILLVGSARSDDSLEETLHTKAVRCGPSPMDVLRELETLVA